MTETKLIEKLVERRVKIKYFLGGWNKQEWKGDLHTAMNIALDEISEHIGKSSAAYDFTKAAFDELKRMI